MRGLLFLAGALIVVACFSAATTPAILEGPRPAPVPCGPIQCPNGFDCVQHSGGFTCELPEAPGTAWRRIPDAGPDAGR